MWRHSQTNNYPRSLVSGSNSKKAQVNNEQTVSIFFYMEKVYPLTRRHGILMDKHEAGRKVRMFNFIQNFLKPRSFKVKVNKILSDTKVQTEGIPQGSVVSPTFFILKINKIVAKLPNDKRFQISIYMDDLQISYRHPKWRVDEIKLKDSINYIVKFVQKTASRSRQAKNLC